MGGGVLVTSNRVVFLQITKLGGTIGSFVELKDIKRMNIYIAFPVYLEELYLTEGTL